MASFLEYFRFTPISIRDLIDIALVAFIAYRCLLLMRGTRGIQMAFGIVILLLFYWATRLWMLPAVGWLLSQALTYIVFAIIVLYQNEIRRGLAGMGKTSIWGRSRHQSANRFEEIVLAATTLASKRIGALVIIERDIGLRNYVESGISLDAVLTYDLLSGFSRGSGLG